MNCIYNSSKKTECLDSMLAGKSYFFLTVTLEVSVWKRMRIWFNEPDLQCYTLEGKHLLLINVTIYHLLLA